jgi:hypothetical protein
MDRRLNPWTAYVMNFVSITTNDERNDDYAVSKKRPSMPYGIRLSNISLPGYPRPTRVQSVTISVMSNHPLIF